MSQYTFDIKLKTAKGHEVEIATDELYGCFTMADGSEGGGLWFYKNHDRLLELIDYDGQAALPLQVYELLKAQPNMLIDDSFDPRT